VGNHIFFGKKLRLFQARKQPTKHTPQAASWKHHLAGLRSRDAMLFLFSLGFMDSWIHGVMKKQPAPMESKKISTSFLLFSSLLLDKNTFS
jgi:hypothetical protein